MGSTELLTVAVVCVLAACVALALGHPLMGAGLIATGAGSLLAEFVGRRR